LKGTDGTAHVLRRSIEKKRGLDLAERVEAERVEPERVEPERVEAEPLERGLQSREITEQQRKARQESKIAWAFSLCRHPPFPFQQQKSELDNAFAATNGVLVNVAKCPSAGDSDPEAYNPGNERNERKKEKRIFLLSHGAANVGRSDRGHRGVHTHYI
jgi:hypothetical protein